MSRNPTDGDLCRGGGNATFQCVALLSRADDADTVVSDVTPNCDEDVATNQVEVITTEDEFERKEVNKESPVVIFSENTQDWTSSEFSFGFEVNEDLVATAATAQVKMEYIAESQPQPGPVQFWPGALDSLDNAILSFGAAGPVPMAAPQDPAMRPLIVGVPVGVPFPVPGYYPHQMIPGAPVPPYPQVYNIPFPHQLTAGEDHEIMAEKNLEDHTISPESGISSASPRSWQSPHHLDLDQSQASPSLQQPGSYPRTAKPQVNLYDALLGLKCIGLNYNHY